MNPPDDKTPPGPEKPAGEGAWLPPRLREKLDAPTTGDDFDFLNKKSSPIGMIITVVVIVAGIGGAWWMYQNNQAKLRKVAAEKAAAERAAFVTDSLYKVHVADSLVAVARADSIAFAALPKWKQRQILAEKAKAEAAKSGGATASGSGGTSATAASSGGAPAASGGSGSGGEAEGSAAAAPEPAGPFGIDAGQFIDEARAGEIAASLKEKTGLPAAVVSMGEGDDVAFHVLLGSYPRRGTAESKANGLLSKGLLTQAVVVALPKAPTP